MTTTRERREARVERLNGWADKRHADAAAVYASNERYTSDIAFNTQPGAFPLRTRVIAAEDRAHASVQKADSMSARADGIERQLATSIYSDDEDAVERLREKLAHLEAKRAAITAENAAYRKAAKAAGITPPPAWQDADTIDGHHRHAAYEGANLSGNIATVRKRIVDVEHRAKLAAKAEASEAGVLIRTTTCAGTDYSYVTFAEKPARDVLNALRDAGYRWGGGSWFGRTADLPPGVRA